MQLYENAWHERLREILSPQDGRNLRDKCLVLAAVPGGVQFGVDAMHSMSKSSGNIARAAETLGTSLDTVRKYRRY